MSVEFTDNSKEVLAALDSAILRGLEECGLVAEGYAKKNLDKNKSVKTGNLRNSITHKVDDGEPAVYIGTNTKYAPYVELGTGKYTDGGRQDAWVYQDDDGRWHKTGGQKAKPYLKPAVADHKNQYRQILENELKNA